MTEQPSPATTDPKPPYFLGVDVGGTNIKIGLVDDLGSTLAFRSIATNVAAGPDDACQRIAATAHELASAANIELSNVARCGLGTPGPMCLKRGMLLTPTNLPAWHYFPARDHLAEALQIEVSFINDANAAAFGEFWIGTGKSHDCLALLTLGTGVGGGLISEGRLINGVNSFGSELGHIVVDSSPTARLCAWGGGQGQLEAFASASGVALRAQEAIAAGTPSLLKDKSGTEELTAKDVYEAAKEGDALALKLVDETAFYLGIGITCAVHTIDPGLVVLGGAMDFGGKDCEIGQRFLQGILDEFQRRTFPNVFEGTKVDFAQLGGDAGYIGAAGIARQAYQDVHSLDKPAPAWDAAVAEQGPM